MSARDDLYLNLREKMVTLQDALDADEGVHSIEILRALAAEMMAAARDYEGAGEKCNGSN